jgi:hypothetical protein
MIERSLVPRDARLPAETPAAPPRRLTTLLDERTIVEANLPRVQLDPHSTIPAHLPLDVLASRMVVPRDMPQTPFDIASVHAGYAQMTAMDQRVTVPMALPVVQLQTHGPVAVQDLPDVLEPDVINTGEVNLMVEPIEAPPINWNWVARTGSIAAHVLLIAFVLLQTRLFPYRPPSQAQIDMARQQLNFIYMPPDVRGLTTPSAPPAPRMRIDPRILRQMAPPTVPQSLPALRAPTPVPTPNVRETPSDAPPDLPAAPKPQPTTPDNRPPDFLRGPQVSNQVIKPQPTNNGLVLPQMSSPGRALEQSAQQAVRSGGGATTEQFGGQIPGAGRGYGGGGGGDGYLGGAVQMLTPTEGIDFTSYLSRVVARVKLNWYAIMPESARLGDQGRVILQFRIMQNGGVPDAEPQLMSTSNKEPLDRAAISSIRASTPFEPLPPGFSAPFIELRFIFLYNLPLNAQ